MAMGVNHCRRGAFQVATRLGSRQRPVHPQLVCSRRTQAIRCTSSGEGGEGNVLHHSSRTVIDGNGNATNHHFHNEHSSSSLPSSKSFETSTQQQKQQQTPKFEQSKNSLSRTTTTPTPTPKPITLIDPHTIPSQIPQKYTHNMKKITHYILHTFLPQFPLGIKLSRLRSDMATKMKKGNPSYKKKLPEEILIAMVADLARKNLVKLRYNDEGRMVLLPRNITGPMRREREELMKREEEERKKKSKEREEELVWPTEFGESMEALSSGHDRKREVENRRSMERDSQLDNGKEEDDESTTFSLDDMKNLEGLGPMNSITDTAKTEAIPSSNKLDNKMDAPQTTTTSPHDIDIHTIPPVPNHLHKHLRTIERYVTTDWAPILSLGLGIKELRNKLRYQMKPKESPCPMKLLPLNVVESIAGHLARRELVVLKRNRVGTLKLMPVALEMENIVRPNMVALLENDKGDGSGIGHEMIDGIEQKEEGAHGSNEEKEEQYVQYQKVPTSVRNKLDPETIDRVPDHIQPYIPALEQYIINDFLPQFPHGVRMKRLRSDLAFRLGRKLSPEMVLSIAGEVARRNDKIQLRQVRDGSIKLMSPTPLPRRKDRAFAGEDIALEEEELDVLQKEEIRRIHHNLRPYMPYIEDYILHDWIPLRTAGANAKLFWNDIKESATIPTRYLNGQVLRAIVVELVYHRQILQLLPTKKRTNKVQLFPAAPDAETLSQNEAIPFFRDLQHGKYNREDGFREEEEEAELISGTIGSFYDPRDIPRLREELKRYLPDIEIYIVKDFLPKFQEQGAGIKTLWYWLKKEGPIPKEELPVREDVEAIAGEVARKGLVRLRINHHRGRLVLVRSASSSSPLLGGGGGEEEEEEESHEEVG